MKKEDESDNDKHTDCLLQQHPPMPPHGQELVEIDLAESDKENSKHEHGHHRRIVGGIPVGNGGQRRDVGKNQINHGTRQHGHWQGPIFNETDDCSHVCKVNGKSHNGQIYPTGK